MAKKAEIAVAYRVNNTLDISVRNMGVRPRLGEAEPLRQWEYVIELRGTTLFKGTDLYLPADLVHQFAAAELLKFFVPKDGDLRTLPWIDKDEVVRSYVKSGWFLGEYKDFSDVHHMDAVTEFPDVVAVLGDKTTAPFGPDGLSLYGDHLDEYRKQEEINRRTELHAGGVQLNDTTVGSWDEV